METFLEYGRRVTYSDGRVVDYRVGLDEAEARALVRDIRRATLNESAVHAIGAELVVRTVSAWQMTE